MERTCVEIRDFELYIKTRKIADQPLDCSGFRIQSGDMYLLVSDSHQRLAPRAATEGQVELRVSIIYMQKVSTAESLVRLLGDE